MKAKKVIKAVNAVRKIKEDCIMNDWHCSGCAFGYTCNGNIQCALKTLMSNAGWEAFQIGAKEVFK